MRIFNRDPAVILGLVSAFLQMGIAFGWGLSETETASINAFTAAAIGLATAWAVARDRLIPAILGFGQAGFTLILTFGTDMSEQQVTSVMAFVALLLSLFVRTQVTAKVAADGSRVVPA